MALKAGAPDIPLGLQTLKALNWVSVKQTETIVRNEYVVTTATGEQLFEMKEDGLRPFLFGQDRSFTMKIRDANQQEVILLRRPHSFSQRKIEVSICGVKSSVIREEPTFKAVLSINDERDQPVLRIKGPWNKDGLCEFELQNLQKSKIGCIEKQWFGLWKLKFTKAEQFHISFPQDLDVRYKAAVIGACVLIDFMYFEYKL